MKLDSITQIERYMTNALLSSTLVPLGVNVIRLADVSDEEGILQMVNSMVVRYTGSSVQTVRQSPLMMERTMTFEVNIASQSYLSQSGHDFAVQLLAAAHETLVNQVPCNTGVEIVEPFHLVTESFTGLTDSSHYTYTQVWQIVVQDYYRGIAIDPCVARGDCSKLFPQNVVVSVQPGQTACDGRIVDPVLPPPNDTIPYDSAYAGVLFNEAGDLVYKWDPSQVFMTKAEIDAGYIKVCTGTLDTSGRFEIINIKDADNNFVRSYFGVDTGNRLLRLNSGLVRILGENYVPETAGNTEEIKFANLPVNGYGQVITQQALLYADPTDANSATARIFYGAIFPTELNVSLEVGPDTYIRVGNTPLGRAWIKSDEFQLFRPDQYLPGITREDVLEEYGSGEG